MKTWNGTHSLRVKQPPGVNDIIGTLITKRQWIMTVLRSVGKPSKLLITAIIKIVFVLQTKSFFEQ